MKHRLLIALFLLYGAWATTAAVTGVFSPIAQYQSVFYPVGIGHTEFELWCNEEDGVFIYIVPVEELENATCES